MCGKDLIAMVKMFAAVGSPPHVRERLTVHAQAFSTTGITPACAGKTSDTTVMVDGSRDHPRMCGKDQGFLFSFRHRSGSPPHVRERR